MVSGTSGTRALPVRRETRVFQLSLSRYTGRGLRATWPRQMTREITTHSAEETIAFGRTLAELLAPPKLVLLRGDLGAGKPRWSRESRRRSKRQPKKT